MNWIDGILITFISKLEWGTVADWVSGIGSLIAIAFAYLQIAEQRKEYEEDKKEKIRREILANRPFFSFMKLSYLTKNEVHLWTLMEDGSDEKIKSTFGKITKTARVFNKDIFAYEFKNVSQAIATKLVLKIEYLNEASDKILRTDYCYIGTCVIGNERAIILPHSIMNEPSTYANCPKKGYLYFTTIDDRAYCQRWIEQNYESSSLYQEQFDILEVSKEEIPTVGACSCKDM